MNTFQVKTESLAVRCEICHQADLFEPTTGFCGRCSEVIPFHPATPTVQPNRYPVQYFRYIGTDQLSREQILKGVVPSSLVASLPGFVVLFYLALLGTEGPGFLFLFLIFYLNSFLPGCFTAYRSLVNLRRTRAFRPLKEFSESVAKTASLATLTSIAVTCALYFTHQLIFADFKLLDLFGSAFCGAVCPTMFLLTFNMLGGHIIFKIQRILEKNNIEVHWGWNDDYFPPPADTTSGR